MSYLDNYEEIKESLPSFEVKIKDENGNVLSNGYTRKSYIDINRMAILDTMMIRAISAACQKNPDLKLSDVSIEFNTGIKTFSKFELKNNK